MADIDIGNLPVHNNFGNLGTRISLDNPANDTGTITTVTVKLSANDTLYVGIFRLVSGTTYRCVSATNFSYTGAGSSQNVVVSLPCQSGDVIGQFCTTANYSNGTLSGGTTRYVAGNQCVVDNEVNFTSSSSRILYLYGEGNLPAAGWGNTIYGISPASIMGVAIADVFSVNGVE